MAAQCAPRTGRRTHVLRVEPRRSFQHRLSHEATRSEPSPMLTNVYTNAIWLKNRVVNHLRHTGQSDRGAALVEYALLFSLIVVVCIAAVTLLGTSTSARTTNSANQIMAAN